MENDYTILVVDDERNILKSIKRLLIDTDYRVLTAESGEKGLEAFDKHEIQVVVSDYRMPQMDGVSFLSKVREKSPDTIRIILSGYADTGALVEAINDGHVYKFVAKPWNDQELLTTIMRAMDRYKLQKENEELYSKLEMRNEELRNLAENLEAKVIERTRDLELNNRALLIAQNILALLPLGVIGIDSNEMIVYMNEALKLYINIDRLGLGFEAKGSLDDDILAIMVKSLKENKMNLSTLSSNADVGLICTPLPKHRGVIGLFGYFLNKEECWRKVFCFNEEGTPIIDAKQI